jgi:hypothetical protein
MQIVKNTAPMNHQNINRNQPDPAVKRSSAIEVDTIEVDTIIVSVAIIVIVMLTVIVMKGVCSLCIGQGINITPTTRLAPVLLTETD